MCDLCWPGSSRRSRANVRQLRIDSLGPGRASAPAGSPTVIELRRPIARCSHAAGHRRLSLIDQWRPPGLISGRLHSPVWVVVQAALGFFTCHASGRVKELRTSLCGSALHSVWFQYRLPRPSPCHISHIKIMCGSANLYLTSLLLLFESDEGSVPPVTRHASQNCTTDADQAELPGSYHSATLSASKAVFAFFPSYCMRVRSCRKCRK